MLLGGFLSLQGNGSYEGRLWRRVFYFKEPNVVRLPINIWSQKVSLLQESLLVHLAPFGSVFPELILSCADWAG